MNNDTNKQTIHKQTSKQTNKQIKPTTNYIKKKFVYNYC